MNNNQITSLLKTHGLRVTNKRVSILVALDQSKRPLSVMQLLEALPAIDRVTLYRALDAFTDLGITRQIDFGDRAKYFELDRGDDHHHITCLECHAIEDVDICSSYKLADAAVASSKTFKKILQHTLEFQGICRKCSV